MADKDHLEIDAQDNAGEPDEDTLIREELLAEIRQYEEKFGMTSEEFHRRWLEGTVPDTYETNSWAILLHALK